MIATKEQFEAALWAAGVKQTLLGWKHDHYEQTVQSGKGGRRRTWHFELPTGRATRTQIFRFSKLESETFILP